MQIIKHNQTNKVSPAAGTTIWEYPTTDKMISGAVAKISGRYPLVGFAINGFKELVFVISGNGFVVTPKGRKEIDVGDEILLDTNEKYAWEGNMTLFMATTPKFDPKKHKIVKQSRQ